MPTLGDLKARIARDLVRDDLTSDIAAAVSDAIDTAAANRFWFNEVRGLTFNTVIGQQDYGAAALADIPYLKEIDALWITVNGQRRNLNVVEPSVIDGFLDGSPSNGEPYLYARQAGIIRLYRVPDRVYPVTIDGVTAFAPLTADGQQNAWTNQGEYLIRTLAKARLCESPIDDPELSDRFFARYEQIKRDLIRETTMRQSSGEMALWGV